MDIIGSATAGFTHDPFTLESLGLFLEEPRPNLLLNSAAPASQNITVAATAYTLSFYGSGDIVLTGAHSATVIGTGVFPNRRVLTFTPTAGTLGVTVSGTVEFANLEPGSFATSWIPTGASQATRSADVASITGDNFSRWFNGSEFTVFADVVRSYSGSFSGLPTVYNFYDGSDSNKFFVFGIGNNFAPIATSGGVSQLDFVTTGITQFPAPNRIAHALRANSSRIAFNGVSATEDTTVTMPIGMNAIAIGSARSNLQWNGPLRRLTFWPQALSTTTLQSITQ
jgi:hypothetical protein